MKLIQPADLVDIESRALRAGIDLRTELIYADAAHPLNQTFKTAIYAPHARMWMHKDLALVVLDAAKAAASAGYRLVLTDCLRTTDAQARMADTPLVRANPHWTAPGPDRLLSPPGTGAHPRGMAVDILLETADGRQLDMGTPLDFFSTDPSDNPAARDYPHEPEVMKNRKILDMFMLNSASQNSMTIIPLASEWWDYRFPADIYEQYAPLSDADLPADMRICA